MRRESSSRRSWWSPARCCCWPPRWPGRRTARPPRRAGGTLRVNLSTTDVQYTDPSLEYESTGWQVEYATALKLLNWKETKAQLFPEAATSFPLVAAGGKRYTFHIRPGQRLSNGEKVTARNFQYAFQRAVNARMNSPAAAFLSDLGVGSHHRQAHARDLAEAGAARFRLDRLDAVLPGDLAEDADGSGRSEDASLGRAVLHLRPRRGAEHRAQPEQVLQGQRGRTIPT